MPIDYATEKHRGFAFIDYELPEDAQAAIDNMMKHLPPVFLALLAVAAGITLN